MHKGPAGRPGAKFFTKCPNSLRMDVTNQVLKCKGPGRKMLDLWEAYLSGIIVPTQSYVILAEF